MSKYREEVYGSRDKDLSGSEWWSHFGSEFVFTNFDANLKVGDVTNVPAPELFKTRTTTLTRALDSFLKGNHRQYSDAGFLVFRRESANAWWNLILKFPPNMDPEPEIVEDSTKVTIEIILKQA